MLSLRRLNLDDVSVIDMANIIHASNGVILEYTSLDSFKTNFNKYFLALNDFKDKISAVNSFQRGAIFEDNVYMISALEDKLQVPINNLFIKAREEFAIKQITDFYFDDINDGSFELNLITSLHYNPITIMEWILLSNLNGGVNISVDMETINPVWLETQEIFDSIYPYITSFCYKEYIQVVK